MQTLFVNGSTHIFSKPFKAILNNNDISWNARPFEKIEKPDKDAA